MVKNPWRFFLFLLLVMLLVTPSVGGCTTAAVEIKPPETRFVDIASANETYALILENADNEDFIILDVRTPEEYGGGHISEAVNLDYKSDSFRDVINLFEKDRDYLVYCHSGKRSAGAIEAMRELGFRTVFHYSGGFLSWETAGLPLVK